MSWDGCNKTLAGIKLTNNEIRQAAKWDITERQMVSYLRNGCRERDGRKARTGRKHVNHVISESEV